MSGRTLNAGSVCDTAGHVSPLALVAIGIDFYPESPIPRLSCAVNDADVICELLLRNWRDVYVSLVVNEQATYARIRDEVTKAAGKVHKNGTLIVTFSGHGVPIPVKDVWEASFLTTDFTALNELYHDPASGGCFTLQDVKHWLNRETLRPQNIVFILDACGSGASIVNSQHSVVFPHPDRHRVTARSLNLEDSLLNEIGLVDKQIVLDDDSLEKWPAESSVAAISAATAGGAAHEDPKLGHGLLSLSFIEWMSDKLLREPFNTPDFGDGLFRHVRKQVSLLQTVGNDQSTSPQIPDRYQRGTVRLSSSGSLFSQYTAHDFESMCRAKPAPEPINDNISFNANLATILREIDFDERVKNPGDANFVFHSDRFSDTRALLRRVAQELADREGQRRPVLFLGTGRIRRIMPFIFSQVGFLPRTPGHASYMIDGPPIPGESTLRSIDGLVNWLGKNNACVVAPYRPEDSDDTIEYFLMRCFRDSRIRVLLALYAGATIPEWAHKAHYRKVHTSKPARDKFRERFENLQLNFDEVPDAFLNETVVSWLESLKEDRQPSAQGWQSIYYTCVVPMHESDNDVRAILNVIRDVLSTIESNSREAFSLLKAMSLVRLPRSKALVECLWRTMQSKGIVAKTDVTLDGCLGDLLKYRLVKESAASDFVGGTNQQHFFVHSLVSLAVNEHDEPQADSLAEWQTIVAEAICRLLEGDNIEPWCPRPLLAREAVCLLLAANESAAACRVVLERWSDFVDSGYHETLLKWSLEIRAGLGMRFQPHQQRGRESLELLVSLLVKMQSLYRHRQEWNRIAELHAYVLELTQELRKRYGSDKAMDELDDPVNPVSKAYRASHYSLADYHFVHKSFPEAKAEYQKCRRWSESVGDLEQECRCLVRLFQCDVLRGKFANASKTRRSLLQLIGELDSSDGVAARKQRRNLRSVEIEQCRLTENVDKLSTLSYEAWTESLRQFGESGGQNRFDLAISHVQMAWAAMYRGEFLRAWRHAGRARQLLNDRNIPEHWWFGEIERVAALAMTRMLHFAAADTRYTPWFRNLGNHPDDVTTLLDKQVQNAQRRRLHRLIGVSRLSNPWRAAELMSALGQFVAYVDLKRNAGIRQLQEALQVAEDHEHTFLQAYILESLAVLDEGKRASNYFKRSFEISDGLRLGKPRQRRKSNWEHTKKSAVKE